jgi:SAM-dependent methyltransferase
LKLNLGCGGKYQDGWVNVDSEPTENPDVCVDLTKPWPWPDSSVDEVFASHLLEHLNPGAEFFRFMQELYRVCKPGATVEIVLPHPRHDVFLNDPTHVQAVMPGTLAMFSKKFVESMDAQGAHLTPFWKRLGVDFDLGKVRYWFDPSVDQSDPELEWKSKHLSNVILEWGTTLTAVK